MIFVEIICFICFFMGLCSIVTAVSSGQYSYLGRSQFRKMKRWHKAETNLWEVFPMPQLLSLAEKIAFVDEDTKNTLQKQLTKAGLSDTPRSYTAKKILAVVLGMILALLCVLMKFYIGTALAALLAVFLLLKLRESITDKIREKDKEIAREMPRFVRTICRNLQSDRDLLRVMVNYRKVSGATLGAELDILISEMRSGNTENALAHFETRLGTADVFRLCSALRDMAMGIDQTATLNYLADSMALEAKESLRKELSLRPSKMRMTYYPAIGVCVAMIMYVLIVYVIQSLNSLM